MTDFPFQLSLTLGAIALLLLAVSTAGRAIKERLYVSEPLIGLVAGVLLGSHGLDLVQLERWVVPEQFLEEFVRVAIAIQIFSITLRLPPYYTLEHLRPLAVLLLLAMPLMMLIGAAVAGMALGVPVLLALVIGAAVAATDPVVAASIVTGNLAEEALPERLRNLLWAESAANDGLAHALVFLPVLLLTHATPGSALTIWSAWTLLWQVGVAVLLGAGLGWAAGHVLHAAERADVIERPSFLIHTLALTLMTLAVARLLDTDPIFAVFACGVVFSTIVRGGERAEEERIQDAVDRMVTLSIFPLLGLALPWQEWQQLGAPLVLVVVLVLLLRRLPVVLALRPWISPLPSVRDGLFYGWFGPIGASGILYGAIASYYTGNPLVWPVVCAIVCGSVVAHGLSATVLTRAYQHGKSRARPSKR
jgi:sodium/hydrogen antiporter